MGHKRRSSAKKKQYAMKKLCQGFSSGLKTLTGRPKVHSEDEVESSDEVRHEEDSDDEKVSDMTTEMRGAELLR